MTLVIEDGTSVSGANAYINEVDSDAYFEARDITSWDTNSSEAKEGAILYATAYLDNTYSFIGDIADITQPLAWPRTGTEWETSSGRNYDDMVPQIVIDATCELALDHITSDLNLVTSMGGAIQSASLGPMSVTYRDSQPGVRVRTYIGRLLSEVIDSPPGVVKIIRA
jgi:hypothetical protein